MLSFWPEQNTLLEYFEMGGFVMLPLILVSMALWYALVYRMLLIRKSRYNSRELVRLASKGKKKIKQLHSVPAEAARFAVALAQETESRTMLKAAVNQEFALIKERLSSHRVMVRSLVGVAPLLGLLGTVDGMIETFDSLADMALFSQSGGIAGGISKALFTTQMGLAISIPGLLMGRMIERRERNINRELDQIRDLVCASAVRN